MESTLFVGLDAPNNSIVAAVVDRDGKKIDQTRLGPGGGTKSLLLHRRLVEREAAGFAERRLRRARGGVRGPPTPRPRTMGAFYAMRGAPAAVERKGPGLPRGRRGGLRPDCFGGGPNG